MFDILGCAVDTASHGVDLTELMGELTTSGLADCAASYREAATRLNNLKLILAVEWADRHPGDLRGGGSLLSERPLPVGGDGAPEVGEAGVDELAGLLGVSFGSARRLVADALDLRHRLPLIWRKLCVGGVEDWKARRIAQVCRPLSLAAARIVDRQVEPWAGQIGWGRLERLVTAAVIDADPELAARLAAEAATAMGVWAGQADEHNLKTIFVKTDPVSVAWFMATLNLIADGMKADGDVRSADERRAAAIGLLARPVDAVRFLSRHAATSDSATASTPPQDDPAERRETSAGSAGQGSTGQGSAGQGSAGRGSTGESAPTDSMHRSEPAKSDSARTTTNSAEATVNSAGDTADGAGDTADGAECADASAEVRGNSAEGAVKSAPGAPGSAPDAADGAGNRTESVGVGDHRAAGPLRDSEPARVLDREPDPDVDDACVAEWTPSNTQSSNAQYWDAATQVPLGTEPEDSSCRCGASVDQVEPHLRLGLNLPAGFDKRAAEAARPRIVLHYHLSNEGLRARGVKALVRPEHAAPMRFTELLELLNTTRCAVKVQPVIDPANVAPADAYEIPDRVRAAVRYRDVAEVSPWGTSMARGLDLDHTVPFHDDGDDRLLGQTSYGNLGPLSRSAHRVKTLGLKHLRQPDPGTFIWRSREGHVSVVTNRGTINLGRTPFTAALWEAAAPPESKVVAAAERIILDYIWTRTDTAPEFRPLSSSRSA